MAADGPNFHKTAGGSGQSNRGTIGKPRHFVPPSSRELRSQAVHRLQIGLLGLGAMLMIVGLANIIMDRARLSRSDSDPMQQVVAADAPAKKPVSDPLADIGVVPAADPSPTPTPTPSPNAGDAATDTGAQGSTANARQAPGARGRANVSTGQQPNSGGVQGYDDFPGGQ